LIIPLLSAILMLLMWGKTKTQRLLGGFSTALYLLASIALFAEVSANGLILVDVGSWQTGFGIALVVDMMSALFILLGAILALVSFWYGSTFIKSNISLSIFHPVFFFLLFGLSGAFVAGDIFNLYVWFEVMLVSSFVLFTIGASRSQLEGALKYVTINVISSAFFLIGVGILYGLTGNLNMAMLAKALPLVQNQTLVDIAAVFFLVSFGIKAAIFPLFFWLPASYHTAPIGFTALVVALLTKVGIYSLTRFFTIIYPLEGTLIQSILLVLAALTMVIGVFGAAAQTDFRKILSFHIVSQIGYMIMGLAIFTPMAIAGALFFVVHNVLVKTNLFFVAGSVSKVFGSYKLKELGGVMLQVPALALLFAISAFSLTGIPPLTGFWGKYLLAKGGFDEGSTLVVVVTAVSLAVSLLTLFSMTKIWNEVFWKPNPNTDSRSEVKMSFGTLLKKHTGITVSIVILTILILLVSFFPNSLIDWCLESANTLVNRDLYINGVLGVK
ncbi:MAG TPA: proton-conducting transporter membrane subunit, partial [Tenuifilaceae bacterium]|nr:proton-conducting transporter membrane subunit [Tenuifilaceae bacterium]